MDNYKEMYTKLFNSVSDAIHILQATLVETEGMQQQATEPAEPAAYDYKVRSVKQSGKNSQLLELVNKDGKVTAAYIKAGCQTIVAGSCLRDVEIEQKTGTFGVYNLINACKLAS